MNQTIANNKVKLSYEDRKENQNIYLYLAGRLVSLLGTYIYNFAVALYILRATGSGTSFAFSVLIGMAPRVILGPFAGSLADRIDRKKMVVGLDILSGIVVLSLVGVSLIFGLKIYFLYIATFLLAMVNTFFDISIGSSLPNLVRDKSLVKINSYSGAASSLASIVSPVIAGMAFAILPITMFLLINGISFILSAISEMFIDFKFNKPKEEAINKSQRVIFKSVVADMKEVLGFIRKQRALYSILKYALLLNFFVNPAIAVSLPYIINEVMKMTSIQFGSVEGAFSVGVLIASIVIGRLPEKEKKLKSLVTGLSINGLTLVAIGIPTISFMSFISKNVFFIYYIVVVFIFAIFMVAINIPLNVTMQRLTPDKMMGRVMGVLGTISGGIAPLGVIIAGIIIDIAPPYIIPFVSGIVILSLAMMMLKNKEMQNY